MSRASNEVVVVSGLPRSGTSLMMKLLEKAGLPILTDNIRSADMDNLGGYYEYEPVKWMKNGQNDWMRLAFGKGVKIISHLLPYLPAGYQYKVVFMNREFREVVASQNAMLLHRNENEETLVEDENLAKVFSAHSEEVKSWMAGQSNIEVRYVDYNELLKDPASQLQNIESFLGLKLNAPDIISVIDPAYYRQRLQK